VNPTALIPVKQPGDLREDRVGQLVKRVLDGVASDETRRAYRHALEMFLGFCDREGNPILSAELVASYRVLLAGKGSRRPRWASTWRPLKLSPGRLSWLG
jgi:hypothetical protein